MLRLHPPLKLKQVLNLSKESLGFFFGNPGPGVTQLCLGLSIEPNSAGIEGALETQNGRHRIGGSVHVNVAGRLGLLGGVSGGAFDDFAETGSAFRGLLALPLTPTHKKDSEKS